MDILLPTTTWLVTVLGVLAIAAFVTRKRRWVRAIAVAAFAWSWILSSPAIANFPLSQLEGPPAPLPTVSHDPGSVVVVLPSGRMYARNGEPRPQLDSAGWERLRAGIALWQRSGGKLLLAGGPRPGASLAEEMRDIAMQSGVPAEAIVVAPTSTTTHEDLQLLRPAIAAATGTRYLVTSALHMPRALQVGRALGLEMTPVRCDYRQLIRPTWFAWLPNNDGTRVWSGVIHEIAGEYYYRWRGFAG